MALKILHTSDVHLGAKLVYLGPKAKLQRDQIAQTFLNVVQYAIDNKFDLFLVAGDLFDSPFPSPANIALMQRALEQLQAAGIFTAVIAGNHDRLETGSVYLRPEIQALNSDKIHIFTSKAPESWKIEPLDAEVTGFSLSEQKSKKTPLAGVSSKAGATYQIGLFHGSVSLKGEADNYPISNHDIEHSNYDYLALGDWHSSLDVSQGKVKAWYSGSPELIDSDQAGAGSVLAVTLEAKTAKVSKVPSGKRVVKKMLLDLTDATTLDSVHKELAQLKNPDMVLLLTIRGNKKLESDWNLASLQELLDNNFFYTKLKDESQLALTPEELQNFPEEMVAGKFIRILQAKKGKGAEQDSIIDEAIQYGIGLLKNKQP